MRIHSDLADTIGNTPLLKLKRASEMTGCTILGKCEFLNPGQSVKDRAALFMIRDAVAKGHLRPGGTIVEGTAGNTGIGLALVGASMGFKTVIVIPETQSQEKKDMLRLAGAELVDLDDIAPTDVLLPRAAVRSASTVEFPCVLKDSDVVQARLVGEFLAVVCAL